MNSILQPPSKPVRRWWLQFSLRTLLVLMFVVSASLGWVAYGMKQARDQQESAERIRELGGMAMQCHQLEPYGEDEFYCPEWLRATLGDEYFVAINYVNFRGSKVTDQDLRTLNSLPQLRTLHLECRNITDEALVELRSLRYLEYLDVHGAPITDQGMAHLGKLPALRNLKLISTAISDAGLAELGSLQQLEFLDLSGTRVTDAGMNHLQRLHQLQRLTLKDTQVTDAGVDALRKALPKADIRR